MPKLLTVQEVSDSLGICPVVIRTYAREGIIKASKLGKAWKFKPADIERYIDQNDNSLAIKGNK